MSIEVVGKVLNIEYGDPTRKLIAIGLANHTFSDGTVAYPAVKKLAHYANCSERTVQRHLAVMLEEGMIRKGDQSHTAGLDPRRRPTVYDMALDEQTRLRWKQNLGCQIVTPAGDESSWGDTDDGPGVTDSGFRGDTAMSPKPSFNHPSNHPSSSLRSDSPSLRSASEPLGGHEEQPVTRESQPTLIEAPSPADDGPAREDVRSLCDHLARRIRENGCKPPKVTTAWLKAARLLLDADQRDPAEAHRLIDWCQDSDFWQANVLSMTKFRQKYDTLRLQSQQARFGAPKPVGPSWWDGVPRAESLPAYQTG